MTKRDLIKEISFRRDVAVSNLIVEAVKGVLETSGYLVWPFGWETTVIPLHRMLRDWPDDLRRAPVALRLRRMPDLVVALDGETEKELYIVEVKYRSDIDYDTEKILPEIEDYKSLWPETHLVLVVPRRHVFYVAPVQNLSKNLSLKQFLPFEEVFTRVTPEILCEMKEIVLRAHKLLNPSIRSRELDRVLRELFPERYETFEYEVLYFIYDNVGMERDALCEAFIREHLVSRDHFYEQLRLLLKMDRVRESNKGRIYPTRPLLD